MPSWFNLSWLPDTNKSIPITTNAPLAKIPVDGVAGPVIVQKPGQIVFIIAVKHMGIKIIPPGTFFIKSEIFIL